MGGIASGIVTADYIFPGSNRQQNRKIQQLEEELSKTQQGLSDLRKQFGSLQQSPQKGIITFFEGQFPALEEAYSSNSLTDLYSKIGDEIEGGHLQFAIHDDKTLTYTTVSLNTGKLKIAGRGDQQMIYQSEDTRSAILFLMGDRLKSYSFAFSKDGSIYTLTDDEIDKDFDRLLVLKQ